MELVNEWLLTEQFRKVYTISRKESTYKNELMASIQLSGNALHKAEMEYHGKFEHTLGRIQHISLMSRIETCYTVCSL